MNIIQKFLVSIGLAEEVEDEIDELSSKTAEEKVDIGSQSEFRRRSQVVRLPQKSKKIKISLLAPQSYDEVQKIAEELKNGSPVLVNPEKLDFETARQLVAFVSGTTFALDGSVHQIARRIFLFAPPNVEITGNIDSELDDQDITNWQKPGRED